MLLSIFDASSAPVAANGPSTGVILTPRTPLMVRGHTMDSVIAADGGMAVTMAEAEQPDSPRRASSLRQPAFSAMNHVLAAGDDELDGLLTHRLTPRPDGPASAALSASVTPKQRVPLVLQASLALWRLRQQARGFRKWKDVLAEPLDLRAQLPALAPGVSLADEARRLLRTAESKRQVALARRLEALERDKSASSQPGAAAVAVAPAAAAFSRAESNLLLLWAREAHAKSFRDVDDLTLREVLRHLRARQYQDGEPLFFEGDPGEQFYLLLDGTVAVYSGGSAAARTRATSPDRQHQTAVKAVAVVEDLALLGRRVFTYRAGESFGETAMFTEDAARTASAVAAGACETLELARDVYARTLRAFHRRPFERSRRLHFAQRVPLFREWPRPRVAAVAEALELRRLSFGDRLLVEAAVAPTACFLVLSGELKLTTQLPLGVELASGDSSDDSGDGASASSPRRPKRPETKTPMARRAANGPSVTITLHSARPGEFVALEALLRPGSRSPYSVVADAADVEVYVLAESDARALLGGPGSVAYQQLRLMAAAAAKQRRARLEAARRALYARSRGGQLQSELTAVEEGGFCDAELLGGALGKLAPELSVETETEREQARQRRAVATEHTTYVPHLDTDRLLAAAAGASPSPSPSLGSVSLCSPLVLLSSKRDDMLDPDVSAVAPPRMLSTCVKNFVFANSDTLASDYVERLRLQFPAPAAREQHAFLLSASPSGGETQTARQSDSHGHVGSRSHHRRHRVQQQQQQQQLLDQHMRRLYETKMHWDASRKSFALVPPPVSESIASVTTSAPSSARATGATASVSMAAPEPLYRQQRAAQETARRLLDERARKQSEKRAALPGKPATTSSFVHFF